MNAQLLSLGLYFTISWLTFCLSSLVLWPIFISFLLVTATEYRFELRWLLVHNLCLLVFYARCTQHAHLCMLSVSLCVCISLHHHSSSPLFRLFIYTLAPTQLGIVYKFSWLIYFLILVVMSIFRPAEIIYWTARSRPSPILIYYK